MGINTNKSKYISLSTESRTYIEASVFVFALEEEGRRSWGKLFSCNGVLGRYFLHKKCFWFIYIYNKQMLVGWWSALLVLSIRGYLQLSEINSRTVRYWCIFHNSVELLSLVLNTKINTWKMWKLDYKRKLDSFTFFKKI